MLRDVDIAWLAGLWDGEGSIGLVQNKTTYVCQVQLSMTCRTTVEHILEILEEMGVGSRGYTYQERDPSKHQDAHYIRVTGMAHVLKMARALAPFAITKKKHWELIIKWIEHRIEICGGLDAKGNLKRGGNPNGMPGYSIEELAIAEQIRSLNRRGPTSRDGQNLGRITRT